MDRTEAIKHLKVVLKTCDVQDEEAVEMAIKALEETHTLNGSTLTIKVSEEDIDKVKRIMLDYAPWCKVFYEDDKDINVPSKSALDHIHNVVAENAFDKGYDAGHAEGYERGKRDAAISASTLAKRLTAKFDDVLSIADVLEELEMVEKGEGYEQGKADAAPAVSVNGNTFMIDVSEEDFDKIKRVIVGCGPMCRTFYEEGGEAHWIKKYTPDDGEIYECDNCGVTWQFNDGGPEENEAHYCPKCGFKMVPKEQQKGN